MASWIAWRQMEGGEVKALPFDASEDPLSLSLWLKATLVETLLWLSQSWEEVRRWNALWGAEWHWLMAWAVSTFRFSLLKFLCRIWVFQKKKIDFYFTNQFPEHGDSFTSMMFVWLAVSLSGCCWMRAEVLAFSPRGTELTNACHQKLLLVPWCLMKHQPWHARLLWRFDQLSASLIQNGPIRFLQYPWSQVVSCNARRCLTQRE